MSRIPFWACPISHADTRALPVNDDVSLFCQTGSTRGAETTRTKQSKTSENWAPREAIRSTSTTESVGAYAAVPFQRRNPHLPLPFPAIMAPQAKQASPITHYFGPLERGLLRRNPGENSRSARIIAASPISAIELFAADEIAISSDDWRALEGNFGEVTERIRQYNGDIADFVLRQMN
jgi:hypothetical protein